MLIRLLRNALGLTLLSTPFVVCTALVAHINRTRSSNMPIVLTVPSGYGYVGLAATGALWLTFAQGILVGKARKQAKIAYPAMYAEKAEAAASRDAHIFNCTQRAHQNTLETLPAFLLAVLFSGLRHPRVAASLGAVWIAARIAYTLGYSSGEPKNRGAGAIPSGIALLSLMGTATYTAFEFAQASNFEF